MNELNERDKKSLMKLPVLNICISLQIVLIIATFNVGVAQYQQISFNHLSTVDGLSNFTIFSIEQDQQGFMWFGTYDRLNRYDGHEFKVYRHDSEDPSSLSDNPIRVLYKDRSGDLWIGTWSSGLSTVSIRILQDQQRARPVITEPAGIHCSGFM